MPIKAQITKDALDKSEETKVHFIPASIDGNGNMNIDKYFNNYNSEINGIQINALRGYPLKGIEMKLPENLTGIVLRESEKLQIDDAERELKFGGKFSKFTYWNYDKNPSDNDAYRKAMHWEKIAGALHSEVESLEDDGPANK